MKETRDKKIRGKSVRFLAAAALSATLLGSQMPVVAVSGSDVVSEYGMSLEDLFPKSMIVDDPMELSEIELPERENGRLKWVDDSIYAGESVQPCEVLFVPEDGVDLTDLEGWDDELGGVLSHIHVVVRSLAGDNLEEILAELEEDSASAEESGSEDTEDTDSSDENDSTDGSSGNNGGEADADGSGSGENAGETDKNGSADDSSENNGGESNADSSADKEGGNAESAGDDKTENNDADSSSADGNGANAEDGSDSGSDTESADKETTGSDTEDGKNDTADGENNGTGKDDTEEKDDNKENTGSESSTDDKNNNNTEDNTEASPDGSNPDDSTEAPSESPNPDDTTGNPDGDDNIFDSPSDPDKEDDRPTELPVNPTEEEQIEQSIINHTDDGITVSGRRLPWYVQFRATSGASYEFTNESDAMIFQSYEFELWDLQNNTEYEIPDGEYVSVSIPVKEGYDYTVEHLLDNGAIETIIPTVEDGIMVFSTHSFSPFGIAGSKQLVGPDFPITDEPNPSITPTPTVKPGTPGSNGNGSGSNSSGSGIGGDGTGSSTGGNGTTGGNNNSTGSAALDDGNTGGSNGTGNNGNGTGSNGGGTYNDGTNGNGTGANGSGTNGNGSYENGTDGTGNGTYNNGVNNSRPSDGNHAVATGDSTPILPFVILVLAAAILIGAVIFLKKRKH